MYINKLKTSRILFLAVGWTISVLLGFVVAYTVGERGYWKVMVLIFFLFLMYVIWARDIDVDSIPIKVYLKIVFTIALLLVPFYGVVIMYGNLSNNTIIDMIPAQTIWVIILYVWLAATEIDPDLTDKANWIFLKGLLISLVIYIIIGIIYNGTNSDMMGMLIVTSIMLAYLLIILVKVVLKRKYFDG